jgi:aldehyde:ferredoxin oxidoreductase
MKTNQMIMREENIIMYGFNGKILWIDLIERASYVEEMSEDWYRIYGGGGLLGTFFMLRDAPQKIDAYDPRNLLVFTSSVIAGLDAPGLARFSVVTKSPLSHGIAETRCEGPWGQYLKGSGYDAVIIKGKSDTPVYILIENGEVKILDGEFLWGKDTNETTTLLEGIHSSIGLEVATIGQAGENLVRYASIVTSRSVQAMRMGVGAVMGSKNLKAVVLKGLKLPEVYDRERFEQIKKKFDEDLLKNELSLFQKDPPGFTAWIDLADEETAYQGVNNYKSNTFSGREKFARNKYMKYYRGDKKCPGCSNDCIKYMNPYNDNLEVSGIHQEVSGSMGPIIGNENLELMLKTNVLCNLLGIDPVSLGFTISFAMECFEKGIISKKDTDGMELIFGNEEDIIPLVKKIASREGFGDILAEGSKRAAERIGGDAPYNALHVKGIEMVSFDPRTLTNLGLGYATAPIGPRYDICEHDWDFDVLVGWAHSLDRSRTMGILERIAMQYYGIDKVRNYKALNTIWSACDALDICIFACAPTRVYTLEMISSLIQAITGWQTSSYEFMRWGERRNHIMRMYNIREGLTKNDDVLPEKFYTEPIKEGRFTGCMLDKEKFRQVTESYYEMMGWDKNGVPLDATLYDYHLEWTIPYVEDR